VLVALPLKLVQEIICAITATVLYRTETAERRNGETMFQVVEMNKGEIHKTNQVWSFDSMSKARAFMATQKEQGRTDVHYSVREISRPSGLASLLAMRK